MNSHLIALLICVSIITYLDAFVYSSLNQSRILINKSLNKIHYRYSLDDNFKVKFFYLLSNMNIHSWEVLKLKFAVKILAPTASNFTMIFGGSSVTAGHDNYYHEAYPFVFEREMSGALKAVNVDLVVRNIAMGSNQCIPSNLCYTSMGGDDFDFIGQSCMMYALCCI